MIHDIWIKSGFQQSSNTFNITLRTDITAETARFNSDRNVTETV